MGQEAMPMDEMLQQETSMIKLFSKVAAIGETLKAILHRLDSLESGLNSCQDRESHEISGLHHRITDVDNRVTSVEIAAAKCGGAAEVREGHAQAKPHWYHAIAAWIGYVVGPLVGAAIAIWITHGQNVDKVMK